MLELDYKKFALSRISAFIKQIQLLKAIDFPYEDSELALIRIEEHIVSEQENIQQDGLSNEVLRSYCARVNEELDTYQSFLGYISNSSHPRNAFEIYYPFRRISESILGEDAHIIISSEWEDYSPVTYDIPEKILDFVFIGVPISEAHNPLITPLSGHELGHTIWSYYNPDIDYRESIQGAIKGVFSDDEKRYISNVAILKCEEYFCDFIGLGLFGESYLYAYSYLLAPSITKKLNESHPNATNRANAMMLAAKKYGYVVPDNFGDLFKTQLLSLNDRQHECLEQTEILAFKLVDVIIDYAKKILKDEGVLYNRPSDHSDFVSELLNKIPISSARSLPEIMNAAWDVYFQSDKWLEIKDLSEEEKIEFLGELTLKSFEILEYNLRLEKI